MIAQPRCRLHLREVFEIISQFLTREMASVDPIKAPPPCCYRRNKPVRLESAKRLLNSIHRHFPQTRELPGKALFEKAESQ